MDHVGIQSRDHWMFVGLGTEKYVDASGRLALFFGDSSCLSVQSNLLEFALRSGAALLVLQNPHAIRHIRWRAENHVITCLQSRTNVDARSVICVEIDLVKLDLPLRNDSYP
jgi:hypothetical protein